MRLARRLVVLLMVLPLLLSALPPCPAGAERASTPLTLEGLVLTGDGAGVVGGASVTLHVHNDTGVLVHTDFMVTPGGGNFTFTVPAALWNGGWNASLRASYPLVGVGVVSNLTLSATASQTHDVRLPWNRTLGARVSVSETTVVTPRDGRADYVVNVTNGGNDTDSIQLWAVPDNGSVTASFHPDNTTLLAPDGVDRIGLRLSGPGLEPADYLVTLRWRSLLYPSETGSMDLAWTILPEVDLSVGPDGVSWWPTPLLDGDDALLNCTVRNDGRDLARLANVSMELLHPSGGLLLRDRVRVDVPSKGVARASFPWTAVYSQEPYTLRFSVEHPLDVDHDDDMTEVQLVVGVTNVPPDVTFQSPANASSVNGTVTVWLSVSDPDTTVRSVRLRIDGGNWTPLGTASPIKYDWDTTQTEDGWHLLEAVAADRYADGPVAQLWLKVANMGPNHPPEVFVEAPLKGDVVDEVLWASGITFDQDNLVERVRVRIDGGDWMLANGTNRWRATVSTADLPEGPYRLDVQAFDGIDTSAVVSVNFSVTHAQAGELMLSLAVEPATVLPSERVRVVGDLGYDNGVGAPGLLVTIQGPDGLSEELETDPRGHFELSVLAPGREGLYQYSASASDDEGLAASNTTQLRVLKSLEPDLSVESLRVESEKVAVGLNVTVAVRLQNLGFKSGNGTLMAWAGPVGVGEPVESRTVTVYDSVTVTLTWVPEEEGEVDFTVEVVNVQPGDVNLSNNRRSTTVAVQVLPDLTVSGLVLSNPSPYDNTTISVSVRVANLGGLNASCTVRLYMDVTGPGGLVSDRDLAVGPVGTTHAIFDVVVVQGPHRMIAEIVNAYPVESRTDNNNASVRFEVRGPFEPPTDGGEDGSIPTLGILGASTAMAAASLAALARGRRRRAPW